MIYSAVRLFPAATTLGVWAWLSDGTAADPAHFLLLIAFAASVLALSSIRRYWHIRATSKSRRDSVLIG